MEAVEVQLHRFLNSEPDKVERSTAFCMEAGVVQVHKSLTQTPAKKHSATPPNPRLQHDTTQRPPQA
jgi:hypothetical protein